MIIAIDAGHGYNTSGKRTCPFEDGRQMREHEFNRHTAFLLDFRLRQASHQTILCFDSIGIADSTLAHRCNLANMVKADIFVSIHANAWGDGNRWNEINGLVAMYYPKSTEGERLARSVLPELQRTTGLQINSYQAVNYAVLKNTIMPAVIIECGFMTNKRDAEKLLTYEYREKCAEGIFNGLLKYFGLPEGNKPVYHVQIGSYESKTNADAMLAKAKKAGFTDAFIKHE
jgi:N-acetylmuramoyl-L-alanine amidase